MDVKEFVSETITQIIDGVEDAQKRVKGTTKSDAIVNPRLGNALFADPTVVAFDIVVTTTENKELHGKGSGKGSIAVFSAKAEAEVSNSNTSENMSRVNFDVKVSLPSVSSEQYGDDLSSFDDMPVA